MPSYRKSATLADVVSRARERGGVDVPAGLSLNELARRAGVSPSQLSRIETGKLRKPSRAILVAISRALNRNPIPLLVLAGHFSGQTAQIELRDFFRAGAEAPAEWGDWTSLGLDAALRALNSDSPDDDALRLIAADLFAIEETAETMWHDAFALTVATGTGADELRRFAAALRELSANDRAQLLAHASALRDRNDLRYQLEATQHRVKTLEGSQT